MPTLPGRATRARRRSGFGDLGTDPRTSGTLERMQWTGDVDAWARLDGRDNALNAIRLVLASTVVLVHSWDLVHGDHGVLPYAGAFAVDGFFVLSGFLIAGSRTRLGLAPFLWRRFLRIMPAFWLALALTALVTAPLSALLQGIAFDWSSVGTYVRDNAWLLIRQFDISGTLASSPVHEWNPPLWTLLYEFCAYIVCGLALSWSRWRRGAAWVLLALSMALVLAAAAGLDVNFSIGRLGAFFAAGMVLRFELHRVPSSRGLAAACATLIVVLFVGLNQLIYTLTAPLVLGYLIMWLGANLPIRTGARNDVSYGVYVLTAPFQQLMVSVGAAAAMGWAAFAGVSMLGGVALAWGSWLLVERPAMRLRRLVQPTFHTSSTMSDRNPVSALIQLMPKNVQPPPTGISTGPHSKA